MRRGTFGQARRWPTVGLALTLVAGLLGAPTAAGAVPLAVSASAGTDVAPSAPATVTADVLPTVQIDGVVWTQTVVGDWVYVGGQFTTARPAGAAPGERVTPRRNLLRYNLGTGELDPDFDLPVNGAVNASTVSPDGHTVYIGGAFTQVGGQTRYRVAAIDVATGAVTPLNVGTNASVYGMAVTEESLYLTGGFSTINNVARARVGAVSTTTGKLLPFTAVLTGTGVGRSIVVSPDRSKVVVAGSFERTNGQTNPGAGIAALDAGSGASLPWQMNATIRNTGDYRGFMGLSADETGVYGTAYSRTSLGLEGSFHANWADGSLVAMEDCHGDSYSIVHYRGVAYKASHAHYCGNVAGAPVLGGGYRHALALDLSQASGTIAENSISPTYYQSFAGQPSGHLLHWYTRFTPGSYTGLSQAAWHVTAGGEYVLYGGEFTAVNGVKQQGLVRFGTKAVAPNKQGPEQSGSAFRVSVTSPNKGQALISWRANLDPDDAELTYAVERRGVAEPVFTTTASSSWQELPTLSYRDVALAPGAAQEFRVTASDAAGNTARSEWARVVVSAVSGQNNAPVSSFTASVVDGTLSVDASASTDSDGRIVSYDWDFGTGVTGSGPVLQYRYPATGEYTVRLTVTDDQGEKTTTTRTVSAVVPEAPAMNLIAADDFAGRGADGWGDATSGGSWSHIGAASSFSTADAGLITLAPSLTRTARLDAVSSMDTITTVRVSSDVSSAGGVTSATVLGRVVGSEAYSARVRFEPGGTVRLYLLRGETPLGGMSTTLVGYTPGTDVVVALSVRGASPTQLGAKMWFASTIEPADWQLTATDGTDALQGPGSVGLMGSSSSLSTVPRTVLRFHEYSVTDGRPAVAEGENHPPMAAFTTATDGLRVVVDATGATDAEGPLAHYDWDFGDGMTGEGPIAEHVYAAEGVYTVTLTVTDSDGATDVRERVVSVTEPPATDTLAEDGFGREATDGWGLADTGGVWSTQGGDSVFSVSNGAARIALAPSWTRSALLAAVQSDRVVVRATLRADAIPEGAGAAALTLVGRQTDTGAYQARVRIEAGGTVRLYIMRDEAALGGASLVLPDRYRVGEPIHVKLQVSGTGETVIAARMWADGTPEPAAWQLTGTDRTDGMQQPGAVGVRGSVSSAVTTPRIAFTVTDFRATSAAP
ncbi:PKD domain-containing protein [Microbacterium gorillae]|uniref:PKD domain-containing protein n=1 Tax=Microbacterium gorillae TaxID=1231063 RepID=UPI003D98A6EE